MVEQAGSATLLGRQLGNYAVKALLGRGATGTVYLAKDTALGRPVALKVLLGSLARSPEQVARFLDEAKAVAPLQHPHIVGVYEAGIREGTPYIAMEYIEGEALDRFLRRNTPLDWHHALYIAAQVIEALHCAHQRGLVHRDVKPANILLDRLGHVRLTDFGIARVQQDTIQRGQGYMVFGTPDFMSPEQCGVPNPIGPQSDFFSLGVMLYLMISGTMPFTAQSTPALIQRIVNDTPVRLNKLRDDVPDDVARLVANLMEKSPERRPADTQTIRNAIQRIQQQDGDASALPEALNAFIREMAEPNMVRTDTPLPGERRPLRVSTLRMRPERKRLAPVSTMTQGLLLLLALAGGLGLAYWHLVEAPQPLRQAQLLDTSAITTDAEQRVWVPMPDQHWLIDTIQWVGDRDVVLVGVRGREGTAVHGSTGILAIDPERKMLYSVSAPIGPLTDAGYGDGRVVTPRLGPMPAGTTSEPLANAFITPYPLTENRRDHGGLLQALAHRWNAAEPDSATLLFSVDTARSRPYIEADFWRGEPPRIPVAIHPDGHTVCLLLYDEERGTDYLVERDVRWTDPERLGPQRTSTPEAIERDSFSYSSDGQYLAYYCLLGAEEKALWVINRSDSAPNGMPLITGDLEGHAFSPDGRSVAVSHRRNGNLEIIFLDVATGTTIGQGGTGYCNTASWHPSGDYIVIQDRETDTGELQLWAQSPRAPFQRTLLTALEGGVQAAPAISRNGTWLSTVSESNMGPALVFLPCDPELSPKNPGSTP